MVHPLLVHVAQQNHPLQLPHQLGIQFLLPLFQPLPDTLLKQLFNLLLGDFLQGLGVVPQVLPGGDPTQEVIPQAVQVPFVLNLPVQEEAVHRFPHQLPGHGADVLPEVLPVQYLAPLPVDDLPLAVHHVVVLQNIFADLEVAPLDFPLAGFDGVGEELVFNGHILFHAHGVHQALNPLPAKEAHQVVLQGDDEPGLAGVPLAAGTAPQLVINAAGFVSFGAQDEEPACLAHLLRLRGDLLLILGHQLPKALAGCQDLLVLRLPKGGGVADLLLGHPLPAQLGLG